ncbi:MAG: hypothetical protein HY247_03195 [archaeon]|nr:MAG: hypothetical protein HY247_03195 [archaeon]
MAAKRQESDQKDAFAPAARAALEHLFGRGGMASVLFYTGTPELPSFEEKLRAIFGDGTWLIMKELRARLPLSEGRLPSDGETSSSAKV